MPRPLWSGTINFGLVTIPVQLFPATKDDDIHFHLMTPDGECRLRRKLVCPESGKEYDFSETARGFEIAPNQYVIVDEEEIEKLRPESGKSIDIKAFVKLEEVDPMYFVTPYYVAPKSGGEKPYNLLVAAMKETGQVAVAQFVMRQKEYLCALRPMDDGKLCLETMHWATEIRNAEEMVDIDEKQVKVGKKELELAKHLIGQLEDEFHPEQYRNEFKEKIEELIESKAAGKPMKLPSEPKRRTAKVVDLMEVLKQSVSNAQRGRASRGGGRRKEAPRAASKKGSRSGRRLSAVSGGRRA